MDVILHLGAHRTGGAGFHAYLRRNAPALKGQALTVWTPDRMRRIGAELLLSGRGTARDVRRARGRLRMQMALAARRGAARLLISDPALLGSLSGCLHAGQLYPEAGTRVARLLHAMETPVYRVALQVRSGEHWWASVFAAAVARGYQVPDALACQAIAGNPRGWRDVVTDLACALPDTRVSVMAFERWAGQHGALTQTMAGTPFPPDTNAETEWMNRSPGLAQLRALRCAEETEEAGDLPAGDGRWMPFDAAQQAELREKYADDLHWLTAGADGLAALHDDPDTSGQQCLSGQMTRGHTDDTQNRNLARDGREGASGQAG